MDRLQRPSQHGLLQRDVRPRDRRIVAQDRDRAGLHEGAQRARPSPPSAMCAICGKFISAIPCRCRSCWSPPTKNGCTPSRNCATPPRAGCPPRPRSWAFIWIMNVRENRAVTRRISDVRIRRNINGALSLHGTVHISNEGGEYHEHRSQPVRGSACIRSRASAPEKSEAAKHAQILRTDLGDMETAETCACSLARDAVLSNPPQAPDGLRFNPEGRLRRFRFSFPRVLYRRSGRRFGPLE